MQESMGKRGSHFPIRRSVSSGSVFKVEKNPSWKRVQMQSKKKQWHLSIIYIYTNLSLSTEKLFQTDISYNKEAASDTCDKYFIV